jgi:hypothetical protein
MNKQTYTQILLDYPITESTWTETRASFRVQNGDQIICSKVSYNIWDIAIIEGGNISVTPTLTDKVDSIVHKTLESWGQKCPK